ncbi:MAG: prepilin-type N-terminal cleavage/methylation domain-containing protein [Tepidisphaeraceae bacterium]
MVRYEVRQIARGFTLVELLVVIGIIALLIAILVPTLSSARTSAVDLKCQSNLRQLAVALTDYATANRGFCPPGQWDGRTWDLDVVSGRGMPGILWNNRVGLQIQQCPAFEGKAFGYTTDPFTGYNYNASYLGIIQGESRRPVRITQVKKASETAAFGDGGVPGNIRLSNKFMRAPRDAETDPVGDHGLSDSQRDNGAQAWRHQRGKTTNVAYVDGHVAAVRDRFQPHNPLPNWLGFLSPDSSAYDLR